ncbi:MAG TPA: hypothetical protein VJI97_02535 [Candidatus Nanoarchaeia archaeon]|nr:hypothetical protein [Candidatus Nanoarchaeia archaeon]
MKNKILIMISLSLAVFLIGCAQEDRTACTMDAKACPDGTYVGRITPDCEFEECPEVKNSDCDYTQEEPKYAGKSADECSRIRFQCEESREYFTDGCGCGCKLKDQPSSKLKAVDCNPEQRNEHVCPENIRPVCGWFDPAKIQCIRYPCAATYSNNCFACLDEKVISWTEGDCPP